MNISIENRLLRVKNFILNNKSLIFVILFAFTFSAYLMFSTVSYKDGGIMINSKLWSDFQSHIPLIKSFSMGDNIPPEYPLYAGEKIRYHFLFYFFVGILERCGIRIDIALNILSTLGMAGLLISIYLLGKKISKSKAVGWIAMIMLLFNSSFSWGYFFDKHKLGISTFNDIISSKTFSSFGPYDDQVVSAFWNLNIYTNQRHLAFSFTLMFIAIWAIVYSKKNWHKFIGIIIIAMMSWMHKAILLILLISLGFLFLTYKKRRKAIFLSTFAGLAATAPGLLYLNGSNGKGTDVDLGFIYDNTSWKEFEIKNDFLRWLAYWWLNLGILPFAALLGWLEIRDKKLKRIKNIFVRSFRYLFSPQRVWALIAISVFALANIVAFAQDAATNHKLINFSVMILNIYAAIFVVYLWRRDILNKITSIAIFILLILGGLFDIFPIFNDDPYYWTDTKSDPIALWIKENTLPSDRFLNTTYNSAPITIAGRRIAYGWDYFTWSIGYDLEPRKVDIQRIMTGQYDKEKVCTYLKDNNFKYIYVEKAPTGFIDSFADLTYFELNYIKVSPDSLPINIYSYAKSCLL